MKLNSSQLDAFYQVAQTLSFTRAADHLHVTQSALSQRIAKLEEELETTLFIRDRSSIQLTEIGRQLLRYCQIQATAEADLLSSLKSSKDSLGGALRIGGFSSINRSLVIPALKDIALSNPKLSIKLMTHEIRELEDLLKHAEVDYILTQREPSSADIESILLGHEQNVLVKSKKYPRSEIYLDHDEDDPTTHDFFKMNKLSFHPAKMRYLDDVYGLIDGVKSGYGIAVLPRHLVASERELKIIAEGKTMAAPIYLQFFRQPYYPPAHVQIVTALKCQAKALCA